MDIDNQIDVVISPEDKEASLRNIQDIEARLAFLVDLSPDGLKDLAKMGDKSVAFVNKCLEVAIQDPSFLPRFFNIETFQRDVGLVNDLQPIRLAVTRLKEKLDDTATLVGSEAYSAALVVYRYAKGNTLDKYIDEMGKRFVRKLKKSEEEEKETETAE